MADPEKTVRQYKPISEELLTGLNNLRESGDLFDVTVIIGGKPFKAHKTVLASLSSYFQVMFTNPGFVDCNKSEIEIKDEGFTAESFSSLLEFMYSGRVQVDDIQMVIDLLHISGFLQVKGAIKVCVDYLMEMTLENTIPFETAYVLSSIANRLNHPDLKNVVDRYVGQSMVALSETTDFLTQMPATYLKELLMRDDLNQTSSEEEILQVVVDWLQHDWKDRKSQAVDLMANVRMAAIPWHTICDIIGVLEDDIQSIVKNIREEAVDRTHRGTVNHAFLDIGYEIKQELGHRFTSQQGTAEGYTKLEVFVKGPENASNIEQYVDKVQFSFPNEERDVTVAIAPFKVATSVQGDLTIPIDVHFKNSEEPRKTTFQYRVVLDVEDEPSTAPISIRCEKLTFWKPNEDFRNRLSNAGGVVVAARDVSFQVTEMDAEKQGFRTVTKYDFLGFKDSILSAIASASLNKSKVVHALTTYPHIPDWHSYEDGVEIEDEVDFGNASHKVVTNLPKFLVARNDGENIPGWRLAKHAEVKACLELVKPHLSAGRRWYICRIEGGKISGIGYHFSMDTLDNSTLGHRLMIKYTPEFSVTRSGKLVSGWRLATCQEVEDNEDLVMSLLKGKKSRYECLVQGGKTFRKDSSCEIARGTFMGLEYQVIVRL